METLLIIGGIYLLINALSKKDASLPGTLPGSGSDLKNYYRMKNTSGTGEIKIVHVNEINGYIAQGWTVLGPA